MICVGIDVAKDKHSIANNMEGFKCLLRKIQAGSTPQDAIKEEPVKLVTEILGAPQRETVKVGLEATGHYG